MRWTEPRHRHAQPAHPPPGAPGLPPLATRAHKTPEILSKRARRDITTFHISFLYHLNFIKVREF